MESAPEPHEHVEPASPFSSLRTIPGDAPWRWLALAYKDLRRHPGASSFYGVCYMFCGIALGAAFLHAYSLFAALSTGFMLMGPVLAVGLYDLNRRAEVGEVVALRPTLTAWRRNLGNLATLAAIIAVVLLIWARASVVIFALFYEGGMPTLAEVVYQVVTLTQPEFTLIYLVVGAVVSAFIYAIAVIGVPLMLDRQTDAITAGITSIAAVTRNPRAFGLWAVIILVFFALSLATLFIGLIVAIPLLGHGTWHAYRDVLERQEQTAAA